MSIVLRVLLIIGSLIAVIYVLRKIRMSQMKVMDALYWFVFMVVLLIISLIPDIVISMAAIIGVESPVNLIYLIILGLIIIKCFTLSLKNSRLEYKVTLLTEEIAIWRNQMESKEN